MTNSRNGAQNRLLNQNENHTVGSIQKKQSAMEIVNGQLHQNRISQGEVNIGGGQTLYANNSHNRTSSGFNKKNNIKSKQTHYSL